MLNNMLYNRTGELLALPYEGPRETQVATAPLCRHNTSQMRHATPGFYFPDIISGAVVVSLLVCRHIQRLISKVAFVLATSF